MRILPRSLRRKSSSEAGFSLAELLSTVVILGVLTSVVAAMFITSVQAMHDNTVRLDQVNTGRTAMETMTRVLRTSVLPSSLVSCGATCTADTAFLTASQRTVSFYADIDNPGNSVGPSRVTIAVDSSGNLTESIQPPDPGSAATGYTWNTASLMRSKLLAQGVSTTANLFTYYLYGSTTPYTTVTGTPLQDVDAIDILLKVGLPGTQATPTTTVERVSLPNVDTIIESSATPSP